VRAALAFCVLCVACGSKPADPVTGVVDAWKKEGLEAGAFTKVEAGSLGGECRVGVVAGLDVTLCQYGDAALAKASEEKGLGLVGETTGASLAQGNLLLVVADRQKADPGGKKLNQLTQTFRRL
jgi:hypothetical protein